MKITHKIKNFKSSGIEKCYILVQRYHDGKWGFADCWGRQYAFRHLDEARDMKTQIGYLQEQNGWQPKSINIIKVVL
jgi:hypothetical protein